MKPIEVFGRYAMAFEEAVRTDDWSVVEPFFTVDAIYETIGPGHFSGCREGRREILEHFKQSLDDFDRRFDERRNAEMVEGPKIDGDTVWIRWQVTYRVAGAPDFVLDGEETAMVDGDRIRRLEDRFSAETASRLEAWMAEHESKLKQAPG